MSCDETCRGCIYASIVSLGICCDYYLVHGVGHRRGCAAGKGCIRRKTGKKAATIEQRIQQIGRKAAPNRGSGQNKEERLKKKREYNREWYRKNREHELARQKERRSQQPINWTERKALTAAKTRARWNGAQSAAIKCWKEAHGITYAEMAERIHVSETTVTKWANEANNADWELLAKLGIQRPEIENAVVK